VPHTFREDGMLHFGDSVLLKSCHTEGVLVFDMSDRITTHDEAYAVTATRNVGAIARSVVMLMPLAGNPEGPVCYG